MTPKTLLFTLCAGLLAPLPAAAQTAAPAPTPVEALSRCLADNTSGKDRKELARWVFLAMAAHPEIQQFAAADIAAGVSVSDQAMARVLTRLLSESCLAQTRAAMKEGGSVALEAAFNVLGQLAMKELMSDPAVSARMTGFQRHVDEQKLGRALNGP